MIVRGHSCSSYVQSRISQRVVVSLLTRLQAQLKLHLAVKDVVHWVEQAEAVRNITVPQTHV